MPRPAPLPAQRRAFPVLLSQAGATRDAGGDDGLGNVDRDEGERADSRGGGERLKPRNAADRVQPQRQPERARKIVGRHSGAHAGQNPNGARPRRALYHPADDPGGYHEAEKVARGGAGEHGCRRVAAREDGEPGEPQTKVLELTQRAQAAAQKGP